MPAPYPISLSTRGGEAIATLAAGAFDLTAQSGKPARCARKVVCHNACTFTQLASTDGVNASPGAVPTGTVIECDVALITFTGGPLMVIW